MNFFFLDGDDAGLFQLERNAGNSARLLVKGRIDRESLDHFLLTIKCFKPADKPSELRKPYNPQVPALFLSFIHQIYYLLSINQLGMIQLS